MNTLSATLLDGRPLAARLRADVAALVQSLAPHLPTPPTLATLLVGENSGGAAYVGQIARRCAEVGVRHLARHLVPPTTDPALCAEIQQLAHDPTIHAILLQHPVPAPLDRRAAFEAIPLAKDVDAVSSAALGRVILGLPAWLPNTPAGILRLLDAYGITLEGLHAVVLGRSPILGRPMASLLINRHATVTLCHSHTRNLDELVRAADLVIAAVGRPRFVQGSWLKPGAIVIDAGYNPGHVGDVDFQAACLRAAAITPVPGGVGPLTIAVLLEQTVRAAAQQLGVTLPC